MGIPRSKDALGDEEVAPDVEIVATGGMEVDVALQVDQAETTR